MSAGRVLLVGIGDLGGWVLEFLARIPGMCEVVAADIDQDRGLRKTNLACVGAAQLGFYPRVSFRQVDLNNVDQTASVIADVKPDVVYNCTTLQSWWVLHTIKKEVADAIRDGAGLGPWAPMHVTLTHKLMRAVRAAGAKPIVVNGAFPDVTNVILSKAGLGPDVGMGNVENLIPRIQRAVSLKLGVPMRSVDVYMVGHHYHTITVLTRGTDGGAPYYLKVLVDGSDIKGVLSNQEILASIPKLVPTPSGAASHPIVASSSVRNIVAAALDNDDVFHAPGPAGLPGAYPVRFERRAAKVVLPSDITLEEAVAINTEAQKFDGVETITDGGALVMTAKSVEIMSRYLGYERKVIPLEEMEDAAHELHCRFAEARRKYPA